MNEYDQQLFELVKAAVTGYCATGGDLPPQWVARKAKQVATDTMKELGIRPEMYEKRKTGF